MQYPCSHSPVYLLKCSQSIRPVLDTLPVFACAAALAALHCCSNNHHSVRLIDPAQTVEIPAEQVAGLQEGMALAITRSDPGDNLT